MRPWFPIVLLASACLAFGACSRGASQTASVEAAATSETEQQAATTEPEADVSAPDQPAVATDHSAVATEGIEFQARAWQAGESYTSTTRMELKLDAEIGLGFLSQEVTYVAEEEELLEVDVLADSAEGSLQRTLHFVSRSATKTLPLVGKKTKQRRVAGKTFNVTSTGEGHEILNVSGKPVNEKLARDVGFTLNILGEEPALFSLFERSKPTVLEVGHVLEIEGDAARRIVGLPFEQLNIDQLQLVLRAPTDPDSPLASFDAEAAFSGSMELGEGMLSMKASLDGVVTVERDSLRIMKVKLKGRVKAKQAPGETGGMVSAKGSGPLSIRRQITNGKGT